MSNPLHIKHRPKYLEDIIGNKETVAMVASILNREDLESIPHAFLFQGPAGTGKTTIARIIRDELGCSNLDYHEFNASDTRGIDTIRNIKSKSRLAPVDGKVKVYLLDELHQITGPAQEAALKLLEDAPDNVFFLLCTTNPEKLKKTLKSRCTIVQMSSLNSRDMIKLIDSIAKKEEIDISPEISKTIIANSDGSPRTAVKLLDSIIDMDSDEEAIKAIESATVSEATTIELCRALLANESWKVISDILKGIDEDPEGMRRSILGYFSKVLLNNGSVVIAQIMECFEEPFYNTGKPGLIMACFQVSLIEPEDTPF